MLRRNSVQALFNGYYFDYQLAAISQNQGFINTSEIMFAQGNGKAPTPGPMIQYPKSECQTPKILEEEQANKSNQREST